MGNVEAHHIETNNNPSTASDIVTRDEEINTNKPYYLKPPPYTITDEHEEMSPPSYSVVIDDNDT